jgi:hypothetical protein
MLVPSKDDMKPAQQGGVSLWYIATRLGVGERSEQWVLNYVRHLIANEGFPKPFPYIGLQQKRARKDVHLQSRWLRAAVDAWFDGFLPPHLVTVVDDRQAARDANTLDQRAEALAGAAASAAAPRQAGAAR